VHLDITAETSRRRVRRSTITEAISIQATRPAGLQLSDKKVGKGSSAAADKNAVASFCVKKARGIANAQVATSPAETMHQVTESPSSEYSSNVDRCCERQCYPTQAQNSTRGGFPMSIRAAIPRASEQNLNRHLEDLRRQKVRFNRAVLKLSPKEAREWTERTVRVFDKGAHKEGRESPTQDA